MTSPLIRHNFLLSSSTVFIFSIQTASIGPSNITHLRSGVSVIANSRNVFAVTPSDHCTFHEIYSYKNLCKSAFNATMSSYLTCYETQSTTNTPHRFALSVYKMQSTSRLVFLQEIYHQTGTAMDDEWTNRKWTTTNYLKKKTGKRNCSNQLQIQLEEDGNSGKDKA